MSADLQSRRKKELVAYLLAAILMIIRVIRFNCSLLRLSGAIEPDHPG